MEILSMSQNRKSTIQYYPKIMGVSLARLDTTHNTEMLVGHQGEWLATHTPPWIYPYAVPSYSLRIKGSYHM